MAPYFPLDIDFCRLKSYYTVASQMQEQLKKNLPIDPAVCTLSPVIKTAVVPEYIYVSLWQDLSP